MPPNKTCGTCGDSGITTQMVGCDSCDVWLHHTCAGITDPSKNPDSSWLCERCKNEDEVNTTEMSTVKSIHTTSSRRSRTAELDLKLLDDIHQMKLKHLAEDEAARKARMLEEEEFLKQRYELLKAAIENDDEARVKNRLSKRVSVEMVKTWLETKQVDESRAKEIVSK